VQAVGRQPAGARSRGAFGGSGHAPCAVTSVGVIGVPLAEDQRRPVLVNGKAACRRDAVHRANGAHAACLVVRLLKAWTSRLARGIEGGFSSGAASTIWAANKVATRNEVHRRRFMQGLSGSLDDPHSRTLAPIIGRQGGSGGYVAVCLASRAVWQWQASDDCSRCIAASAHQWAHLQRTAQAVVSHRRSRRSTAPRRGPESRPRRVLGSTFDGRQHAYLVALDAGFPPLLTASFGSQRGRREFRQGA
jgi:hypothetical protein